MIRRSIIVLFLIVFFVSNAVAYNDDITHPDITDQAIGKSQLDKHLKTNIGLNNGISTRFTYNNQQNIVKDWLKKGSADEDSPICRASNHFHDPLESWDKSYMSDDNTPIAIKIRAFCTVTGWPTFIRKSNVTWATGYLDPAPEGKKASFFSLYEVYNWDKARDYYYKALTSLENSARESFFAKTFETVGHTLHLLQDVSVPAHVRNDFQSHLTFNEAKTIDITKWVIQPFEHFIKENKGIVEAFGSDGTLPEFPSQSLTKFWDTDQYTGSNPSSSTSIGLAEYANANFLSDTTIFKVEILDPLHSYPYPAWSSVEEYDEIEVYTGNSITYLRKVSDGEKIEHLAKAKWYYKYLPSFMKKSYRFRT